MAGTTGRAPVIIRMSDSDNTTWMIEAQGIGRQFGTQKALTNINLQIAAGEIFGLLGPDGAGKTSLMQILAAILDPSEGTCRVLGFDTVKQTASITARIGYMSQGFTLYDRLTVDENLVFSAKVRGIEGSVYQQRRQRLLSMADLTQFSGRRAGNLSGGMRKKLSLCTNLIHEPPLLLLDELSLGVDPVSRRELWQMLREFRESGTTIVVTTPYMDEANYCDRLALLDHGQILALDSPDAMRRRGEGSVFELETSRAEEVLKILTNRPEIGGVQWLDNALHILLRPAVTLPSDVIQALQNLGRLHPVQASLEDVFVQMTAPETAVPIPAFVSSSPTPGRAPAIDVVRLKGVTCRFGDFTAVDNVTLTVPAGEVFGFLGPNGAGKTTLIRAMCALLKPASGELQVAGVDVVKEPMRLRSRIGYMSQRFSLYTELTVAENLSFFAGVYGISGSSRMEAIAWASDVIGLSGMEDRQVQEISGALRQRLALACSVLHKPAVLFLDEPTSGVDPVSRQRFWQLIQSLASTGMTIFVTTHYLEEATYCHRLGLMYEGRLIAAGSIPDLRSTLAMEESASMEDIFMAYIEREKESEKVTEVSL